MENSSTWGPVEHVINEAYVEWQTALSEGGLGASFEYHCATKLRDAGLLAEDV